MSLNLLEPSGPVPACIGIALPFRMLKQVLEMTICQKCCTPSVHNLFTVSFYLRETYPSETFLMNLQQTSCDNHPSTVYKRETHTATAQKLGYLITSLASSVGMSWHMGFDVIK